MPQDPSLSTPAASLRNDPSRWQTSSPRGSHLSDEDFGALEAFPEVRRFACSVCGTKQFVLADARISAAVKAHWDCECTRGPTAR